MNPELTVSLGLPGVCGFAAGQDMVPGSFAGIFKDVPFFFLVCWSLSSPE